jgi:hypothetical protein
MMEFLRLMLNGWNNSTDQMNYDNNDQDIMQFFKSEYKADAQSAYEYWRSTNKMMSYS